MSHSRNHRQAIYLFHGAITSWILVGSAFSQSESLVKLTEKSRLAMEQENWEQALKYHADAVTRFGNNHPYESYGAQFGSIFYRKGVCEMKLKRWAAAMASFEICYRDFPNRGADRGNIYHKMALLKWGEAAMGAEKWELAKSRFNKFMDERDRTADVFPKGSFYVNMAICEYRLGNVVEGNENLEIAIQNKVVFPTPESGIVAAFQAFVRVALETKNEQALLDFVGKNRGELVTDQDGASAYNGIYLKLAGDVLAAGMERAALLIYQLVSLVEGDPGNDIRLAALALIHERNGNIRGAFAAYRQMERFGRNEVHREDCLYHLIRTAILIGEPDLARVHASRFLMDFPMSKHRGEVEGLGGDLATPEKRPLIVSTETVPNPAFSKNQELATAMDLYQGRKYEGAKSLLGKIKVSPASQSDKAFAAFYEIECFRRMGDLKGMASALERFELQDFLRPFERRQLEIHLLWDVAEEKSWSRLLGLAEGYRFQSLLDKQRVQVAFLEALALHHLGRTSEALNAYHVAIVADAGASVEIASQAAVKAMELHLADPEVQTALANWENIVANQNAVDDVRLREVIALASFMKTSGGMENSLPGALRKLLEHQKKEAGKFSP